MQNRLKTVFWRPFWHLCRLSHKGPGGLALYNVTQLKIITQSQGLQDATFFMNLNNALCVFVQRSVAFWSILRCCNCNFRFENKISEKTSWFSRIHIFLSLLWRQGFALLGFLGFALLWRIGLALLHSLGFALLWRLGIAFLNPLSFALLWRLRPALFLRRCSALLRRQGFTTLWRLGFALLSRLGPALRGRLGFALSLTARFRPPSTARPRPLLATGVCPSLLRSGFRSPLTG